jgi:hypothetical protein
MAIEVGSTEELTNTQYAPVAVLMAYYESQNVLERQIKRSERRI